MQAPVLVMSKMREQCLVDDQTTYKILLDTNMERESGRKAQLSNITAAKVHNNIKNYEK